MTRKERLTREDILNRLYYMNGELIRKDGEPFGWSNPIGYRVCIKGIQVKLTQLLWFIEYGEWTSKPIKFIDGNPKHINIKNLALQTLKELDICKTCIHNYEEKPSA